MAHVQNISRLFRWAVVGHTAQGKMISNWNQHGTNADVQQR